MSEARGMITLCGLAAMLIFGALGYWRGALRMVASLLALLVAGLLASPLSGLGAALLRVTGLVPRSLLSPIGMLVSGILLFVILMIPIEWKLRQREAAAKEAGPADPNQWNRFLGGLLGVVWGTLLTVLVLTGIFTIGKTQRAMRLANAEIDYRAERRRVETMRVQRIAQVTRQKPVAVSALIELESIDDSRLKPTEPSQAEGLSEAIEHSIFSQVVRQADPIDAKSEKTLRDLSVTVGDPYLFDRFQTHPKVQQMINEPQIQALSKDPEIAAAIRDGRFRDLLDNQKLAEVASDRELAGKLQALNLPQLLREVRSLEYGPVRTGVGK